MSSYRKRHDTLVASIREHLGDKARIVGADAGLHILLGDGEKRDQSELINLARSHDVRVYGTDRYWMGGARACRLPAKLPRKTREPQHPEGGGTLGRRERELVFAN